MNSQEVFEILRMLPSDKSYKEFYFSKGANKEIEMFSTLEKGGFIEVKTKPDAVFIDISLTDSGLMFIRNFDNSLGEFFEAVA